MAAPMVLLGNIRSSSMVFLSLLSSTSLVLPQIKKANRHGEFLLRDAETAAAMVDFFGFSGEFGVGTVFSLSQALGVYSFCQMR